VTERLLYVLMHDHLAGVIEINRSGRYRLVYDEAYLADGGRGGRQGSVPLSLSLPLNTATHTHKRVHAYLQGLLPDNPMTLGAWAERFGVSPRNPFALLEHVGEECAGAVRLLRPDRVEVAQEA
jgi:serine/threonine-protein kinase HipA